MANSLQRAIKLLYGWNYRSIGNRAFGDERQLGWPPWRDLGVMGSVKQPNRSEKSSRVAAAVVVGLSVLLSGALLTLMFGMVHGEEFSPSDFQRRSFFCYQIPFVGGQISPVFRESLDDPCSELLRKRELIPNDPAGDRWDVVYRATGGRPRQQGSAYELCAYLDMPDEKGKSRWLVWTRDHPDLARILWPVVATMALEKLYFAIPEMMERAGVVASPEQLRSELEGLAAQARKTARSTDRPASL